MTATPDLHASLASTRRLVIADCVHRPRDAWGWSLDIARLATPFGHRGNALCR